MEVVHDVRQVFLALELRTLHQQLDRLLLLSLLPQQLHRLRQLEVGAALAPVPASLGDFWTHFVGVAERGRVLGLAGRFA